MRELFFFFFWTDFIWTENVNDMQEVLFFSDKCFSTLFIESPI